MSGVDHNSSHAVFWFSMLQGCEESDKQNLNGIVGTSASENGGDCDWGFVYDRQRGNNNNNNNTNTNNSYSGFGMCSSSEGFSLSVDSEAHSRISAQGQFRDEFVRKSVLGPHNESLENSMKQLSMDLSLSEESDEADLMPSEIDRNDMQSESTINLEDGTHEINFQVPQIGMVFSSEEEAYNSYKNYATQNGFSVRKAKTRRLADGTIRKRYFFCSKEGFRSKKQSDKTTKYKRKETRTGCNARVEFTINNGVWKITHVILDHNHVIEGPDQRHIMCPSTNVLMEVAKGHSIDKAGTVEEVGVADAAGFYFVDSSDYLPIEKINVLPPEDGQSLIDFLKRWQLEDPSFFYTVQVDANSRLINFFWRDGRSKIDYEYFGDVLILDTTFRIDRFDIICAPFLGLNHHQQYVLFGCAFLLDDSMDSFVWLFRTFVEAMGMRPPKTIFTDECKGISDAIEAVLPRTQHRLGMWYVIQNARKNLSECFRQPGFEDLFNKCLFCCTSKEEFMSLWDELLVTYNLHENSWLKNLHMMQGKWSHVFSKVAFSAGIESFKEYENITNIFHNSMSGAITLSKFVQQYLTAAEHWRREEQKEDFHCIASEPTMYLKSSEMEKQAAEAYTRTIFKLFQEELRGCLSLAIEQIASDGGIFIFKLTEEGHKENIVEFNCLESKVTCSCKKYESIGILCVHSLKVLNARNIFHMPSQYLLKRWTKSAKEGMLLDDHEKETADESPRPLNFFTSRVMHKALHVVTKSVGAEEGWKIVENHLDMALREIEYVLRTRKTGYHNGEDAEHHGDTNGSDLMEIQTCLLSPPSFSPQDLSKHSIKVRIKRKQENEVRWTEGNSCDDAITHYQARQVGDDQGSRTRFGSPHRAGENSWQKPSQMTFRFTGNMQKRMPRQKKISKLTEEIGESSSH